jgi:hypothetical protein
MPTSISQQREAFALSNTQPAFENSNVLLETIPSYFNKQPIEQAKSLPTSSFKTTEQETPTSSTEPTPLVPITNSSVPAVDLINLASTPLPESSINTVLETAKQPAELANLSLTSSKTTEQARTNPIIASPSAVTVDKPIDLAHAQKLFESSNSNSATETTVSNNSIVGSPTLPLTAIDKKIEQTATDVTLANAIKIIIPASAASNETINPVSTQHLLEFSNLKTSALANTVNATTLDNNPSTLIPINQEIERTETGTTLSNETKFTVPESVALNEVKPVPLTPIATKPEPVAVNNESATTIIEADLPKLSASTVKAFTARSTQVSSPDMRAKQPAAVLLPLRNQATPKATAIKTASPNTPPVLPSATANRLQAAVDPALQQAYQVTQQQLQTVGQDSSEAHSSELIRNTFNVSVAMNNNSGSDSIDLSDFEQALTEVLRIAARRQGLEV